MRLNAYRKSCKNGCGRTVAMVEATPGYWRCMEEAYLEPDPESTVTALAITGETVSGHFEDKPRQGLVLVYRPHLCPTAPKTED